ncbi:hypothetical protein [uncultured Maritimibacter sp.]|uniref:hypothetical protein n=1 Tax=uncultured Maritimibacter sp. TaxID=991866 RepID=UPI0026037E1F|nr:hypothetical protein [uncultured Maritimibacter sp.]
MRWSFLLLFCTAGPVMAEDVTYRFQWQGAGGYSLRGVMSFDESLAGADVVYEGDLTCFAIEGYEGKKPIGRWALGMLTEETSWTVTFLPEPSQFVVYSDAAQMPQAWNMNGLGEDCGTPGFGFNIGNQAQDLCLNGEWVWESQVEPSRPFPAVRDDNVEFPPDACRETMMLSGLR